MADKDAQPEGKKKLPLKMFLVLAVVLLVEGAAISAAFMLAGGPSDVQATQNVADSEAEQNRAVECLVVTGKFQNTRSGQPYLYDTEVGVTVKQKHREVVEAKLAEMQLKIGDEVTTVFRRAQPAHLDEPDRKTISRQIHAALDRLLGEDADGEKYVIEVLIPRMRKYSSDI